MLIAKGNDPNAMANSGGTSLMFAAGAGHLEAAKVLLDAGADVNAKLKATAEFLDQVRLLPITLDHLRAEDKFSSSLREKMGD